MLKMQSSARRKAYITAMKLLMGVAAVLTCALVVGMIGYILGNGIPNITWEMLSTAPSYLANRVGILPDILSTLYIVIEDSGVGFTKEQLNSPNSIGIKNVENRIHLWNPDVKLMIYRVGRSTLQILVIPPETQP